jgi:predicted dinucleotide-utilizing enzyme
MPEPVWEQWSQHVLKALERLEANDEGLRDKLEEVRKDIVEIKGTLTGIDDLKAWKHEIDEVVSPTQLKELIKKVDDLEKFKVKIYTIYGVTTVVGGIILAILAL